MKVFLVWLFTALAFYSARSEAFDLRLWNAGFTESYASSVLTSGRRSANDPRFSFEVATSAYAEAAAPDFFELEGEWVLIGSAVSAQAMSAGLSGFFSPDGKYESRGYSGYFRSILSIAADTDAFNKPALFGMLRIVGYETGKVYESEGPTAITIRESEATMLLAGFTGASEACLVERQCRVIPDSARLICRAVLVDERSACKSLHDKQPFIYELLQRKND